MAEELKDLHTKLNQHFEAFKTANEKLEAERKTFGEATAETKATVEKVNQAMTKIEGEMKEISLKIARMDQLPGTGAGGGEAAQVQRKAQLRDWARTGRIGTVEHKALSIGKHEQKALSAADDTTGGYLQNPDMMQEIIKGVVEFSPVRPLVRVRSTSNREVTARKRTGTFTAVWVGEREKRDETDGLRYGVEVVPTHELSARVDISKIDLEDSAFDLEGELNTEFGEQFGVAEGLALITGNGIKKLEGLLGNADIGFVSSGDAALITADGLISLRGEPKTAYAKNGSFLLNRKTLTAIRKLKDGTGQYIWQPGLALSQPNTIDGAPYVECPDMPDIAANAFPVLFGDYRRGYLLVDRVVIEVTRDPFTLAEDGLIKFVARKRVGGQVVLAEAIKKLKIAA